MDNTAQSFAQKFSDQLQKMSIFEMLGAEGTEEEKDQFLSQIQDVIWQDVVEKDLAPLLNDDEISQVEAKLSDDTLSNEDKRDYLFDLIMEKVPQAEQVLLDRTMQLKSDLLHERLHGMDHYFANDAAAQTKLQAAHGHLDAQEYDQCVALLNELSSSIK